MNRQWNVVAALAVVITVVYVAVVAVALFLGVDAKPFAEHTAPIVTAVLGYLARMLAEPPR